MDIYNSTSLKISKVITESYSTSFSMATSLLKADKREAIYAIYGFVRLADEIVDTFHDFPKKHLLETLETDVKEAIQLKISTNPILHSFQLTVNRFGIPYKYIDDFLASMKNDLTLKTYESKADADKYIYGSADVVGLMCLKVFTNGNSKYFDELKIPAMKLGSAFQKVNFLRDLEADSMELGRNYFPELAENRFDNSSKTNIINDIEADFEEAFKGIKKLPDDAKTAVLAAYYYYLGLLRKIKKTPAEQVLTARIRISDTRKVALLIKSVIVCKLKLV